MRPDKGLEKGRGLPLPAASLFLLIWAGGRLPTEAEWEKAARDIDGRKWAWGGKADAQQANLAERLGQAAEVGSFAGDLSPYGCLDLTKEWTASLFAPYPTGEFQREATGDGERAIRGGCWRNSLGSTQAASRDRGKPTVGDETRGSRYVLLE